MSRGRRAVRRGADGGLTLAQRFEALPGRIADFDPQTVASVTKDGSNNVSAFASLVGGYSVSQGTGAAQPVWQATGLNGFASIRYDGSDDFLDGAASLATAMDGVQPYSTYWIGKLTTAGTGTFKTAWSIGNTADITQWVQAYSRFTTDVSSYARSATANTISEGVVAFTTAPFDFADTFTGSTYSGFVNGVVSLNAVANTRAPVCDRFTLGALAFGGAVVQPWLGDLGRLVIFDRAHSAAERNLCRGYLRSYYNL